MAEPIRMSYRLETNAERARAWKIMTDTDAFNRVAQTQFTYVTETGKDGTARTVGTVRKLGMTLKFHEEPFSFRAPRWFQIRRIFQSGPAASVTARAELQDRPGGGTLIAYDLEVVPRSSIFRPIVGFDLKRTTEKTLGAALSAVVTILDHDDAAESERAMLGPPPALNAKQTARLEELAARLPPSQHLTRLVSFIRAAPEREQSMISALALAQAWYAPLDEVVATFIEAAKVGLLAVRVDVLCPSCLVPKAEAPTDPNAPRVHCDTCKIPLDPTYPESLAVHFFPSPEVRELRTRIECLGSPSRTPQVLAQETVAPGQEADLTVELEPGAHQLRTYPQIGPAALLMVGDGEPGSEARFALGGTIHPQLVQIRPEPRVISFKNDSSGPVTVVLEKLVPPRKVLTLGRLVAEFPQLREVVPAAGYYSTMACFVAQALAIRFASEEPVARTIEVLGRARVAYASGCVVLAIYPDADALFYDLASIDLSQALAGIAHGPAFEHVVGGKIVPMGPAVDQAYEASCSAYPHRVAARHATVLLGELARAAQGHRWAVRTSPYGGHIAWYERGG